MKKITLYSSLAISLLMLFVMPGVIAITGVNVSNPNIGVKDFAPKVWMCDNRVVYDDATEPGRVSLDGETLIERLENYAFQGEQISWTVLVMDKNKIDQNIDVYATVGDEQGDGNEIEANCIRKECTINSNIAKCNARIDEEKITTCNPNTMDLFECTLTVEDPDSMYGPYWITIEAKDGDGNVGTAAENEHWFLNPVVALSVDGSMTFEEVIPGTDSYSNTLLVGNEADVGSGVMMDMFISGTDFYDSSSSGARCPTTNELSLDTFRYYATNGAYSTSMDMRADAEGYVPIRYGIGFNNPNPFYGSTNSATDTGYEIIHSNLNTNGYFAGNILAPGATIPITFKLSLPEPCVGDFDRGSIYFWGEAI